jgi:hypothetical protein
MSFNIQSLRQKAQTRLFSEIIKSQGTQSPSASTLIKENNQRIISDRRDTDTNVYDIFLSHSSKDAPIILGVLELLNDLGYSVYVDWIDDPQLERSNITKTTANTLRIRMNQSRSLLYATTHNATSSKWMPWELGYMDGKKDRAAILPIFEDENNSSYTYKGQEYLGIYPYAIETTQANTSTKKLWIFESSDTYVLFDLWLSGLKPHKH